MTEKFFLPIFNEIECGDQSFAPTLARALHIFARQPALANTVILFSSL